MKNLYDKSYFTRYSKTVNWESDGKHMSDILFEILRPTCVLDIGCGSGRILESMMNDYGCTVKGIDYSPFAFDHASTDLRSHLCVEDATAASYQCDSKYDLVICTEVAEHIPEAPSLTLVDNLCKSGDTILFSAAVPGQFGTGHINCREVAYWIDEFAKRGFTVDDASTQLYKQLCAEKKVSKFYIHNGNIFRKK